MQRLSFQEGWPRVRRAAAAGWRGVAGFFGENWKGIAVIAAATIIFFWPIVTHLSTMSPGGDAMFNSWTLARGQHCLFGGCKSVTDGNIFYPNKDTLVWSEAQLSTAFVTLPLRVFSQNPLFVNNFWTVFSTFLLGFCMYLFIKYLSRGKEGVAILGGLIFAFAPFRISAIWHLQNLSIFTLPLAALWIFRYRDTGKRRYLIGLLLTTIFQFYASFYQAAFLSLAVGVLLLGLLLVRLLPLKRFAWLVVTFAIGAATVLPLAKVYVDFSKSTNAGYSMTEKTLYSSSLADYLIPSSDTLFGKVYYHFLNPTSKRNGYNPDSRSYHGITLYVMALCLLVGGYLLYRRFKGKKDEEAAEAVTNYKLVALLFVMAIVGLIISLGPFLKLKDSYVYILGSSGTVFTVPMPYLLVDLLAPHLSFIRAIGRASVIMLFALCAMLAFLPYYLRRFPLRVRRILYVILVAGVVIELMPIRMVGGDHSYGTFPIPAAYKYIKNHPEVNDIVVLAADDTKAHPVPIVVREDMLWAGYDNRYIFNGDSGYFPPQYTNELTDFTDFDKGDLPQMRRLGLRYIMVDKLWSRTNPGLVAAVRSATGKPLYDDSRYALFKIPQ